jgi:hypothetical protein
MTWPALCYVAAMSMLRHAAIFACLVGCGAPPEIVTAPPPPERAPDAGEGAEPVARAAFESPGGMWLPRQLPEHTGMLKQLGLELDPTELADPMAYPLGAVVSLGGCSASFVSARGLVITNHHCVTGALQYNSTPEANLLEAGFRAAHPSQEKSIGPTGRVYVTQAFSDVTDRVRKGLDDIADHKARYDELEKREKALIAGCEKAKPNVRCELASYYGGAQYLLIERLEIKDVRLVYAPPAGIGNYGGEIDNWRWPRHTGDFAVYRAYVGKDGKPAEHAADNVAYEPRHHLKLASRPLGAGDLVLVAGYPGRTYRLTTADEAAEVVEWYYPRRIELFQEYIALLEKLGADDAELKIKATSLERGLNNALTYTRGSLEGLTKGGAAAARRRRDDQLGEWINATPDRARRHGQVFSKLSQIFEERARTRDLDFVLEETSRFPSLLAAAVTIVRMAEERPKPDADREPAFQERNWERLAQEQQALEKRYSPKLDGALLELALARSARLLASREDGKAVRGPFVPGAAASPAAIGKAVKAIYAGTKLGDTKHRLELLRKASTAELRASRDPLIRAASALWQRLREKEHREDARSGAFAIVRPDYVAALREMTEQPIAPDANGTLRVTYGTVRGYRSTPDAPIYEPFTRLSGVVEKHTGKSPFNAPPRLIDRARDKQLGAYADAKLGDLPVNFLADLDITGGNSGSPTLDARGELVGLAFDGNYEAMASDWLFMPEITRSIHVDLRYALWVMDAVDQIDWLLRELGVEPGIR